MASLRERIEQARAAQQANEQAHDVQLELADFRDDRRSSIIEDEDES